MTDHAKSDRQALIAGRKTPEQKLRDAINTLGERYLCHPANHVRRNPQRTPDSMKTDVARTFARARRANGFDLV